MSDAESELGQMLMRNDRVELNMRVAQAARDVDLQSIQVFTQKGLYTRRIMEQMGLTELQREINSKRKSVHIPDRRLSQELKRRHDQFREQVRDLRRKAVSAARGRAGFATARRTATQGKAVQYRASQFPLSAEIVYRMAKKLVAMHSLRKKVTKRGVLNVPRTLRHNMSYDGHIFDLHWKSVKIDRPRVFAICESAGPSQLCAFHVDVPLQPRRSHAESAFLRLFVGLG